MKAQEALQAIKKNRWLPCILFWERKVIYKTE